MNNYKYYGNYNKNIKAIKGGGVITPANPPNRTKTTESIKNTWDEEIIPTPPLSKTVYYSNKNLTNGYLNENNFVLKSDEINDYYYPSQKFNNVINLKKKISKESILNDLDPIQLPPPLINSKYTKDKIITPTKINKTNKEKDIEYIVNNTIYDGKYVYMIEDELPKIKTKPIYLPYMYKKNNLPNKQEDTNIYENFDKNITGEQHNYIISNTSLLVIFSILLIIYFMIYQK